VTFSLLESKLAGNIYIYSILYVLLATAALRKKHIPWEWEVKMARYCDLRFKQKLELFFPIHHNAQILSSHLSTSLGPSEMPSVGKVWEY
jgi:hypothetical protein